MADIYRLAASILYPIVTGKLSLQDSLYSDIRKPQSIVKATSALVHGCLNNYNNLRSALISAEVINPDDLPRYIPHKRKDSRLESAKIGALTYLAMSHDLKKFNKITGSGKLKRDLLLKIPLSVEKKDAAVLQFRRDIGLKLSIRYLKVDESRYTMNEATKLLASLIPAELIQTDECIGGLLKINSRKWDSVLCGLPEVSNGRIIMMDKASCLSAVALDIHPGDMIVDVCAAPGSKTLTFLSSLRTTGLIVSIEKDVTRYKGFVRRMHDQGGLISVRTMDVYSGETLLISVSDLQKFEKQASTHLLIMSGRESLVCLAICRDFFDVSICSTGYCCCNHVWCLRRIANRILDPIPPGNILGLKISLDPSCSGTGLERAGSVTSQRIENLQSIQTKMLTRATSFAGASLCLYTTCSLFCEENEYVVAKAIQANQALTVMSCPVSNWVNAPVQFALTDNTLPEWASKCIRASPQSNECRGFFLAKMHCSNDLHT